MQFGHAHWTISRQAEHCRPSAYDPPKEDGLAFDAFLGFPCRRVTKWQEIREDRPYRDRVSVPFGGSDCNVSRCFVPVNVATPDSASIAGNATSEA